MVNFSAAVVVIPEQVLHRFWCLSKSKAKANDRPYKMPTMEATDSMQAR
jgi:hypothetical protein